MNGTLEQFFETIAELKTIYPFENDKTYLTTFDVVAQCNRRVQLTTKDEQTGATVLIEKALELIE